MPALDSVEWESCLLEPLSDPVAEKAMRKAIGMVPDGYRYFFDSGWWPEALIALSTNTLPLLHVSSDLADAVALVVSQDSACRYCFNITRGMLGILGYSEARIRRLEDNLLAADFEPTDRAALQFARRVSRSAPVVTAADAAPFRTLGWSDAAVAELAAVVAVNIFFNRASTLPALPYEEAAKVFNRTWMRLTAPVLRRFMRPPRARQAQPLDAAARQGPFAPIVNALDGLPVAPRLRAVLDACLRESALGPRATALVFAVIGRGLGCPLSEQEGRRMLRTDGMSDADIDAALTHLDAPVLTPLERAAATLARDSIWPQPAPLQRQARAIRSLFSRRQFIDLIGVASLANACCRLAVAVDLERAAA